MLEGFEGLGALADLYQGEGFPIEALIDYFLVLYQVGGNPAGVSAVGVGLIVRISLLLDVSLYFGMPGADDLHVFGLVAMPGFQQYLVTQRNHLAVLFHFHVAEDGVHQGGYFFLVGLLVDLF